MSTKVKLFAAAVGGIVAISAMATTSASAQWFFRPCHEGSPPRGCGADNPTAVANARARQLDISPSYMKNSDPRYNSALSVGGGGGGGGGR
jgi:hypothetical protein